MSGNTKRLAPDLFDRRFADLVEMGRARLPALAPDWTDHNAHDPGITLLELLAWVTEAQLYALGRMRRDERAAYAALFGLSARGTTPARGMLWPDPQDPRAPAATWSHNVVIPADAVVHGVGMETPTFRPAARLLWVPGRIVRVTGQHGDGSSVDYTAVNARGAPAFAPFGATAGRHAALHIDVECRSGDGLFPPRRADADGALWPIGVRADAALAGADDGEETPPCWPALTATLVTPAQRTPLGIVADTSCGLLRSGVLLLDMSKVRGSPAAFTIVLRAPDGFARPPRLLAIAPNVVPIVQGCAVQEEVHVATGEPDWTFMLNVPGLRFAQGEPPLRIVLRDPVTDQRSAWQPGVFADSGPHDAVYAFDAASGQVAFGNGVNGRIPPAGASMLASYAVSDGDRGGVAANRHWEVQGFAGVFGVNPDPVAGGAASAGWIDDRRAARQRARTDHALVSGDDIVQAALALPLLEVARAWIAPPAPEAPRTGVVTLVAMRARAQPTDAAPETARWCAAVRRRLAPRIPLATRLVVVAPRYIRFAVQALVEVAAGRDPALVQLAMRDALAARLALTGAAPRRPGAPLGQRDLAAWLRVVDGVQRVVTLRLLDASSRQVDDIGVPRNGLPVIDLDASLFDARRATVEAAP